MPLALIAAVVWGAEPNVITLPSWRDGSTKQAIISFVEDVTNPDSPNFLPPEERIAVFDNDGTLWVEQPLYIQAQFVADRVRELATQNPALRDQQPYAAILANATAALTTMSTHDIGTLIAATHAGMTTDQFKAMVVRWFWGARHPVLNRPLSECVYQPMLELLAYLRANGFQTYIVTGGGIDFLRAMSQKLYGVPPAQVVGSSGKTQFQMRDGVAELMKLPEIGAIDDGPGKPVNIHLHIGAQPVLAFGNSDGDLEMLQYVKPGGLALLLHHDDAEREFAYDRHSKVGKLDKALDMAREVGWTIVSMQDAWEVVFPER